MLLRPRRAPDHAPRMHDRGKRHPVSPTHLLRTFQKSVASLGYRQNSLLCVGDDRYNEAVYTFAAIYGCTVHAAAASILTQRLQLGKMHSLAAFLGLLLCCSVGLTCEFVVELPSSISLNLPFVHLCNLVRSCCATFRSHRTVQA